MSDKPAPILQSLFDKKCHVCGSDHTWFGFVVYKADVWFCSTHWAAGQALAASVAVRSAEPGQGGEAPDRGR